MNGVEVIRAGAFTTVQDAGRHGYAHLGVGESGAVDQAAYAMANRLLGNDEGAAALEVTLGGFAARFVGDAWIAVTGAPAPVTVDGQPVAYAAAVFVPSGAVVELGLVVAGLRSYVAVRGGIAVEPVLGSRSTDVMAGIGPAPIQAGTVLPIGLAGSVPMLESDQAAGQFGVDRLCLRIVPGPRADWFTTDALRLLCESHYVVSNDSNRVALRLEGAALPRAIDGELRSEGVMNGAVQVPTAGQPVVFLNDHPVTGGYPVIAVVLRESLSLAAQARPGDRLCFELSRGG